MSAPGLQLFEGADQTAHYAYIQRLADTGHAPVPGKAGLSRGLDRYEGPMRYNDSAPFEATYRRFRLHPSALTAAPTHYTPSDTLNWEAQHPPFFHGLMVMRFSARVRTWSALALAVAIAWDRWRSTPGCGLKIRPV